MSKSSDILQKSKDKIVLLIRENKELKEKLKDLEKDHNELLGKNNNLRNDYHILKLSKAFGQSEDDKKRAYRKLTNMITEIEKCIKLLND